MIRNEPIVHTSIVEDPECGQEFVQSGWLKYFLKLEDFNEEIATEFAMTFSNG